MELVILATSRSDNSVEAIITEWTAWLMQVKTKVLSL